MNNRRRDRIELNQRERKPIESIHIPDAAIRECLLPIAKRLDPYEQFAVDSIDQNDKTDFFALLDIMQGGDVMSQNYVAEVNRLAEAFETAFTARIAEENKQRSSGLVGTQINSRLERYNDDLNALVSRISVARPLLKRAFLEASFIHYYNDINHSLTQGTRFSQIEEEAADGTALEPVKKSIVNMVNPRMSILPINKYKLDERDRSKNQATLELLTGVDLEPAKGGSGVMFLDIRNTGYKVTTFVSKNQSPLEIARFQISNFDEIIFSGTLSRLTGELCPAGAAIMPLSLHFGDQQYYQVLKSFVLLTLARGIERGVFTEKTNSVTSENVNSMIAEDSAQQPVAAPATEPTETQVALREISLPAINLRTFIHTLSVCGVVLRPGSKHVKLIRNENSADEKSTIFYNQRDQKRFLNSPEQTSRLADLGIALDEYCGNLPKAQQAEIQKRLNKKKKQ